ncbi:MAG: bifunctional methylenetetrahydrofolate dehydrogenase/methenyltetrahydrofolate cyclohydrolase [Actinobacteria bacterium]|nr:bifunctional methylenetetrahydrofolate dehydrogenase/methenyltetrahydrofolate cyclohydrolase [Actinomycetota bacterium]NBO47216.1 bifunctional methylenetetrahydrofolate dehydrogenase/methenyltetrahydrofolate cyclohydrolase [Actinomycetota bacterium]NBP12138.1 bifunctional methylenetetrahydrofolate dehydrogenase/methenyltetrahydrofolate cyclohydrolase [Actinomycetota bacterium]NBP22331.1 bifunctional methylenetetrahydrofolate dehydrogenase/methenyltetrahydrofolate cyclohydrolase [Actinomycetot
MAQAKVLDGVAAAKAIRQEVAQKVAKLKNKPGLATVLVGADPGSKSYVNGKHRDCSQVGINSIRIELPEAVSQRELLKEIDSLNASRECSGFIVQLPLPAHINTTSILSAIDPDKDADGLHPVNLGKLLLSQGGVIPCTPKAILELLRINEISLSGREVVIIGRGTTVGRPLSLLLSSKGIDATMTIVHSKSRDIRSHTKRADIVIAALGRAHFLTADMVKQGVVAIDVGITRTSEGLVGDIDPEVIKVASAIAPMPGGVGPMTRAMLLSNLVALHKD